MRKLLIVDAHQHFWDLEREAMPRMTAADTAIRRTFGPAELAPLLVEAGVAQTVLVQAACSDSDTNSMFAHATLHDWIGCRAYSPTILPTWRSGPTSCARAAAHGNVAAKSSGLNTVLPDDGWGAEDLREAVTIAVGVFGPDRLVCGSDWPVALLNGDDAKVWREIVRAIDDLASQPREQLHAATAVGLYGLDAGPWRGSRRDRGANRLWSGRGGGQRDGRQRRPSAP